MRAFFRNSTMQTTLHIVPAYQGTLKYIAAARTDPGADLHILWSQTVLDPFWQEWAADQFNEARTREELSTPVGREDLDELEREALALEAAGIEAIVEQAYGRIAAALPTALPDKAVCILALNPARRHVLERQNGVTGSCVGDNILLEIHPGGENWQRWVPYVLAHEYNHTVAGYTHFYLKGRTCASLLDSMIFEGLADTFANSLFPGLDPTWTRALTSRQETEQWKIMQPYLDSPDPEHYLRFIFGRGTSGAPAFTGYTIGFRIVQAYLRAHPTACMPDLVMMDSCELLAESGYRQGK